jgi:hypothetical protein
VMRETQRLRARLRSPRRKKRNRDAPGFWLLAGGQKLKARG